MAKQQFQLVHANLAHMRAPLNDPIMAGYSERLDEIDSLAERFPGFISQPKLPDAGKFYNGDVLLHVSIWEEVEMLERWSNKSKHAELHSRPEEWFYDDEYPPYVLFWVPAGGEVTEREIKERFELLVENGPSPTAFTIQRRFTVEAMLTAGQKRIIRTSMT